MICSYTYTVINRLSEIVAFVANFKETPDLATYLNNNYLAKSGGTMIGPLKWANVTALPEQTSPKYFVCIDAFADGGTTKYASKAHTLKALTGLTSTAIGDSDEPVYWNGTTFVKASAYPTKSSWNYDDIYSKLGHTHNNYVTINTNQTITNCKIFKIHAPVDDRETVYYNIGLQLSSYGDNHKKVAAIGLGNEPKDWYKAAIGFERTDAYDRGDIVFLLNNKSDRTTCVYSDIKVRINANGNINTLGSISANGFIKTNSSNSYILLGGGDHKLISDFATASQGIGTVISINKSLTPTTSWIDTGIKTDSATFPEGNGSYIVQISVPSSSGTDGWGDLYTGYFSLYTGTDSSTADEILLHGASHSLVKRIYLKTKATAKADGTMHFYIASEKAFSAARTINFKFRKLI